jgi:hypothetical protein
VDRAGELLQNVAPQAKEVRSRETTHATLPRSNPSQRY